MKNSIIIALTVLAGLLKGQSEFVPQVNRATGSFTSFGSGLANVTWVYPDERTFNENTGTYIFLCAQPDRLISVNVTTGSVVTSPTITGISKLQFNRLTNKLHGLQQVNANNTKNFLVINPATAAYTVIGSPLPGSSLFQGCFSAMDNVNNKYSFLDPNNTLYTLNALTGSVIASPTLALSPGQFIFNMEFDNVTGQLYGILRNNPTSTTYLCIINRQTGAVTTLGSGSPVGAGSGSGAIDEATQQYMFLSTVGYSLTTFNMATGNPVFNSVVSSPNNINFSSLKYDNIQAKLYCIYWGYTTQTNPPAQPGAVSGATTVCSGASQVYSVSAVLNATSYTWVLPGGWSGTSVTNSILVTFNAASGTLSVSANNQGGSSTTQTVNITVNNPSATLSQSGAVLYAGPGNTYQWLDCNNNYNTVATGSSSFAPGQSGSYAVVISVNGCRDTSSCQQINLATVGINNNTIHLTDASVYPSPNNGSFKLQINADVENGRLVIMNVMGQQVFEQKIHSGENLIQATELSDGLYNYSLFNDRQKIKDGKLVVEK